MEFTMHLSLQGKNKTQSNASKRPTSTELPEENQEIVNNRNSEKPSQNVSITDHVSQMTPNDFHQCYKYSGAEENNSIMPRQDSHNNPCSDHLQSRQNQSQERTLIFNSLSLYDRYNKLINLNVPKNCDDGTPSRKAYATIQNQNVVSESKAGSQYAKESIGRQKKIKKRRSKSRILNSKEKDGGHQVTIVVVQDKKQVKKRYLKSQERERTLSPGHGIRKLNTSGVPIRKVLGRLKNLRISNTPESGLVQINFPITRQSTLLNSQADRSNIHSRQVVLDGSQQIKEAQKGKKHSAQFEVIKTMDQIVSLATDTVSEGTNRMSAAQIKMRQSKVSTMPINYETMSPNSPQETTQKDIQLSFDQQIRRSLEFKQARSSSVMGSDLRNQTKSKSIDSGGAVSNVHDMLKPKGIEGFQQSFGASDIGTPKDHGLNILKIGKQRLSDINEINKDLNQSHARLDERCQIVPKIKIDHGRSGEVITAKLNSSGSERAISMMKDKSLSDSVKKFKESQNMLNELEIYVSQSSIVSSIKTSIDDETLMNLAQKGICAQTPVVKYPKASRLKIENQNVNPKTETDNSPMSLIAKQSNRQISPMTTIIGVISTPETPDSNLNGGHLNSTYQKRDGTAMSKDRMASGKDLMNIVEPEDQSYINKSSNRKIVASKQSLRNIIFKQSPNPINFSNFDLPGYENEKKSNQKAIKMTENIHIGTLDTPKNGGDSFLKTAQENTTSDKAQGSLTFTSLMNEKLTSLQQKKTPVKRAEMEAMSQTDFAPLPPLDHPAFTLQHMSGNYDMFVDGVNDGSLQDFSIAGHLTGLGAIQTDSIMEQAQEKKVSGTSLTKKVATRQTTLYGTKFMQQYPQLPTLITSKNETRNQTGKLDLNTETITTENLRTPTTPVVKLTSPKKIQNVTIETAPILTHNFQMEGQITKMMHRDQNLEVILKAASQGKRVICKIFNGDLKIMNQRPEEQFSSPKRHHLISLHGQPLQAVNLQERNRLKKVTTMKKLQKYDQCQLKLSKDFKTLTRDVMMERHSSQGIDGVDKSIGGETSHSAGSYTKNRKYYILNIDNTKEDGINLATYKSRDTVTPAPEGNSNINSMLSRQNAKIVEQKSKEELDRDGIVTDRNLDSSNEHIRTKQFHAFPSARNNQCQSRQEDLETVYMQSTLQFNKELPTNNQYVGQNKTSKSPEPFIGIKDFTKNKNNHNFDRNHQNLGRPSKETDIAKKKLLPSKQLSQVSTEKRQIQLKNGCPVESRHASVTQVQDDQLTSIRTSMQKTGLSSKTHDAHIGNVRMNSNVLEEIASPKAGGLIQIKDESVSTRNQKFLKLQTNLIKQSQQSQQNCNKDLGSADRNLNSVNRIREKSESGGSHEKLYVPVAAIKVSKIRSSLNKMDPKRSKQQELKKVRPKTVENAQGRKKQINDVPDSPRNRKIIYLMHRRREIALRTKNREATYMSDPDPNDLKTLQTNYDSNIPKPSFFDVLSQQMSKVFSLDNTSTKVVSTMVKNTSAKYPIHQSLTQERISSRKKRNEQINNKRMQLHLTINPCSNSSLVQTHRNPVSLRSNMSTHGNQFRRQAGHLKITSAIINHAQHSPILNNCNQAFANDANFSNMLQTDNVNTLDRYDQPLFDAFLASRQNQRAGLKTAEGFQRAKHLSNIVDEFKTNAVMSNKQIDLQNQFKRFDRRNTNEKIQNREYNIGPVSQDSQKKGFIPTVVQSFSQKGANYIMTDKSKPAIKKKFETQKRAVNIQNIQEYSRGTSTQNNESAFGNLKEMTLYDDTVQETPMLVNQQYKNPNVAEICTGKPFQTKSYSFKKKLNQTFNDSASDLDTKDTKSLQKAVQANSQAKNGGPILHTQSRKQARLLKQGLVYQRNQRLKQIVIEEQNNENKLKSEP